MKHRHIIALLVIANALADAVAVGMAIGGSFPHPAVVVAFGLLFSQIALAAIWLSLGNRGAVARIAAYSGVVASVTVGLLAIEDQLQLWLVLLALQTLGTSGPLTVARWFGLRLRVTDLAGDEQPWQFTIKHVFALTTACALLLGLIRLVRPWIDIGNSLIEASFIGGGFAVVALVAAWVSLGRGRLLLKAAALPVATFLVGGTFIGIEGSTALPDALGMMAIVFGQMVSLSMSLMVLRRLNYRLTREARFQSPLLSADAGENFRASSPNIPKLSRD